MIHWSWIIYFSVIIPFLIFLVKHLFEEPFSDGKYRIGFEGWVYIFVMVIWTLIWGGFFWW